MCGINLILDFDGSARSEHMKQMMGAIKHRGPDDAQHLVQPFGKGNIFLGSNRLKIIDQNNGSNQPFISQDGRYALIFNGEIYNFEELRNELLSCDVQFLTRSDTETLLYWFIKKGKGEISKLNGMFAFVFVDFQTELITIARDPLGIKPLFAARTNNQLVISSEIKGVLASGLVKKELNEDAIPHYLAYKFAKKPITLFKGIEEVLPGTLLSIDAQGTTETTMIPPTLDVEPSQNIASLLINSVVQQYSETNNTGIMLSGGVDSTLLLAILNKELGYRNIPVFSVTTKGKNKFATKDGRYSAEAAKLYEAEYNEIWVNENSLENLGDYIKTLDQPIADSGGYLTWLIAQKASINSKVLLSGAGADELFGGYNRHKAFHYYLMHRNKPWFKLINRGKKIPSLYGRFNQLRKFVNAIETDPSSTFNNFLQSDSFRINGSLWKLDLSIETNLRKALEFEQHNYLVSDVLAITDNASMQHSIETRVPYLDRNLVKTSQNAPVQDLYKKAPKWMLKEQLSAYGGKDFANRKKQGFGLPMNAWLQHNKHWEFNTNEQLLHQFVPQHKIAELRRIHASGKKNLTQELYRVLLLNQWLSHNF